MKLSRLCLAALISTFSCCGLSAGTEKPHQDKKLYVDSQAISVTKEGILINTQAGVFSVKVLRSDEKGLFVLERDVSSAAKGWGRQTRRIRCRCGCEFSSESAYWDHVESGRCPYYPKR